MKTRLKYVPAAGEMFSKKKNHYGNKNLNYSSHFSFLFSTFLDQPLRRLITPTCRCCGFRSSLFLKGLQERRFLKRLMLKVCYQGLLFVPFAEFGDSYAY